jgi:hypothetical protein
MRRLPLTLLILIVLMGACAKAGSSNTRSGDSGIYGTVLLGPTCPVETAESPCPDHPLAAEVVVSGVDGRKGAGVRSGDDGTFTGSVPPGDYVVTVAGLEGIRFAKPLSVSVPDGRFVQVTVSVDSGIRGPALGVPSP